MHGLSCSAAHGILVPRAGVRIEPVSPAWEGRFLATGPAEKSLFWYNFSLTLKLLQKIKKNLPLHTRLQISFSSRHLLIAATVSQVPEFKNFEITVDSSPLLLFTPPTNHSLLLLSHVSRVRLCATPKTAAHQVPRSLGFCRQEHWSGFPFSSPMHAIEK